MRIRKGDYALDFRAAMNEKNPHDAIRRFAELIGQPEWVVETPIRYDEHTGEPLDWGWRPQGHPFDGELPGYSKLEKWLSSFLNVGEAIVVDGLVIMHMPSYSDGEGNLGGGYRIVRPKKLEWPVEMTT